LDKNDPSVRSIEWWTGSVLELRCCLSSTEATVRLGNKIKEVCMHKAKETKATDLNRSAIAAAAATLSHQVNHEPCLLTCKYLTLAGHDFAHALQICHARWA
jgi:hypothetical protein